MKQSKNIILNIVSIMNKTIIKTNKPLIKENNIEWSQQLNTYLGNKGYTLLKNELSINHQIALKERLMVKPFVPGSPVQNQKTYPVYRESNNKIYIILHPFSF